MTLDLGYRALRHRLDQRLSDLSVLAGRYIPPRLGSVKSFLASSSKAVARGRKLGISAAHASPAGRAGGPCYDRSRRAEAKKERSTKVIEVVCRLLQGKVEKPFRGLANKIDRPALARCKVG
jgi:hypothetical protein